MAIDTNYTYIIAAYLTAFILLSALAIKITFSFFAQKKINRELTKNETKA